MFKNQTVIQGRATPCGLHQQVLTKPALDDGPASARESGGPGFVSRLLAICCLIVSLQPGQALALEELNEAQTLIYATPHLKETIEGQVLVYDFQSVEQSVHNKKETRKDTVRLSVVKIRDEIRRDLAIEFLSDEHRLALPDFSSFKGNPVIIAMLENVARQLSTTTEGNVVYFRNRIRDALAGNDVTVEQKKIEKGTDFLQALRIQLSPFTKDAYLKRWPELADTTITIDLSDSVPGSLVQMEVSTAPDGEFSFSQQLTVAN